MVYNMKMSQSKSSQEENTWAIPDYDPWLEAELAKSQEVQQPAPQEIEEPQPETKRMSAAWLAPVIVGGLAAALFLTPQLVKLGSHDKTPIRSEDDPLLTNKLNGQDLRPRLISSARKVVKFAAKHPRVSSKHLSEDTVITVVSGQAYGDKGKIRLVTERQGDSREVDPRSALSLGIVHKSDDGAGNRLFESVLVAAPSDEANMWLAQERTSYKSSGNRPLNDQRSSTGGDSSLIATDTKSILDDAMFAIEFDPKLSRANP